VLEGKSVVITRPEHQAGDLADIVKKMGGNPIVVPTVEIGLVSDFERVKEPFQLIASGGVDLIVFMSQNGVTSFVALAERLNMKDDIAEALGRMQVVAIGSKTKARLEERGISVDITPDDYSSDGLANTLLRLDLDGMVIALPRTDKPTDYLNKRLSERQVKILQFPVYETRTPSDVTGVLNLIEDIQSGKVDVITFTSSATAQNLFRIADGYRTTDSLKKAMNNWTLVAAIGPMTEKTLKSLGVQVQVTPDKYTIDAMMTAVDAYFERGDGGRLDDVDRRLLEAVQRSIPLEKNPWDEVGKAVGLSGSEVFARIKRLSASGKIRKMGPIIDARKVGLGASTLVGMRVAHERIEEVAEIVNNYEEVSHNYERDHEYNLWFTVTAADSAEMSRILREIIQKAGVKETDVMNLPTERLFKVKVNFKIEK
jgi:uroporphyrinogen-III synthase/DNA-binding Lrp family transcriptional regulator